MTCEGAKVPSCGPGPRTGGVGRGVGRSVVPRERRDRDRQQRADLLGRMARPAAGLRPAGTRGEPRPEQLRQRLHRLRPAAGRARRPAHDDAGAVAGPDGGGAGRRARQLGRNGRAGDLQPGRQRLQVPAGHRVPDVHRVLAAAHHQRDGCPPNPGATSVQRRRHAKA
eukprot:SAG22_NODE_265_length_13348_cov_150.719149_12_plen_168_part_00